MKCSAVAVLIVTLAVVLQTVKAEAIGSRFLAYMGELSLGAYPSGVQMGNARL
jgi:hypothetical protein